MMLPDVRLDHILLAVADLTGGARRLEADYGLRALPGGRHPGVGTANMIVPLGSAYLELIVIVDREQADRTATGRRVARAVAEGRTFATWAVRTPDLATLRARLRTTMGDLPEPIPGARERPDGITLRWHTQFLTLSEEPGVLPFVIEWAVPAGMHPAETAVHHPSRARGVRLVRLGDPYPDAAEGQLRSLLGGEVEFTVGRADQGGVLAVELDTPDGVLVVR